MSASAYRLLLIAVLAVVAVVLFRPEIQDAFVSATAGPRPVEARGALTDAENIAIQIFADDSGSVVQVVSEMGAGAASGGRVPATGSVATGSGFLWDGAGHIVTNNHVVEGAQKVSVRLASGEVADAQITGTAPTYDLAVIKIASAALPKPLQLGASADLKVGQAVFAIGNPFGLEGTMTSGIVSALKRHLPTTGGREIPDAIQTDASINPGNSGGPLLDSAGRLVGVTSAIISPSGTNAGIGFAIPVDEVNRIVPELIRSGRVPVPGIGVSVADESVAAQAGIDKGVVVVGVVPGSPADRAGLHGVDQNGVVGDIILAADGRSVASLADLTDELEQVGVGKAVDLTVAGRSASRDVKVDVVDIGPNG